MAARPRVVRSEQLSLADAPRTQVSIDSGAVYNLDWGRRVWWESAPVGMCDVGGGYRFALGREEVRAGGPGRPHGFAVNSPVRLMARRDIHCDWNNAALHPPQVSRCSPVV